MKIRIVDHNENKNSDVEVEEGSRLRDVCPKIVGKIAKDGEMYLTGAIGRHTEEWHRENELHKGKYTVLVSGRLVEDDGVVLQDGNRVVIAPSMVHID